MSLRDLARGRIVEDMVSYAQERMASLAESDDLETGKRVSRSEKYMVMVVDRHTLKVLSGACRNYHILERGVTVVEQIEKVRQPVPDFDSIYFLSPSEASVRALLADFGNPRSPQCKRAHVFFSGKLSDAQMDVLAKCPELVNKCASFAEMYLHYVPYDGRVFHSDQPLALKTDSETVALASVETLLSVCASLRERPQVRFQAGSPLAEKIGAYLQTDVDGLWAEISRSRDAPKPRASPATVLVLDRSADWAALFLHEFFYEAMVVDVLDGAEVQWSLGLEDPKEDSRELKSASVNPTFSYDFQTAAGKERRQTIFGDQDDLFGRYRHMHFDQVRDALAKEVQEFTKKHATLANIAKGGEAKGDLLQALRSLPEYQEITRNYWVHLELTALCAKAVDRLKLLDVAKIEHELATGLDEDGKEVSVAKVAAALAALVQTKIADEEKIRLILLYVTSCAVSESAVKALVAAAGLKSIHQQLLDTLLSLPAAKALKSPSNLETGKPTHRLHADKTAMKKNKARAKEATLAYSRFVSKVTDIAELALSGGLDESEFPRIPSKTVADKPRPSQIITSANSAAAQWGLLSENAQEKPRVIIFVVGGVTVNEIRTTDILAKQHAAEIFLGGSTILTPKRLTEILWSNTPSRT